MATVGVAGLTGCGSRKAPVGIPSRWRYDWADTSGTPGLAPVVATVAGGTVYLGASGELVALDAVTGRRRWTSAYGPFAADAVARRYAPAVAGGTVYAVRNEHLGGPSGIHALDAVTGRQRWVFTDPGLSTPVVAGDGLVYAATPAGLHALDAATGKIRWQVAADPTGLAAGFGQPVLDGASLYVTQSSGTLAALDAASGRPRWQRDATADGVAGQDLTLLDGTLYYCASTYGAVVHAVDPATGAQRWKSAADPDLDPGGSPLAAAAGLVLVGSANTGVHDRAVTALDPATGARRWKYATGAIMRGTPAPGGAVVYAGADSGIAVLDRVTGRRRSLLLAGWSAWPVAVAGRTLYALASRSAGDPDHTLFALRA
jgi:outer membrane protein assembly factor BamB